MIRVSKTYLRENHSFQLKMLYEYVKDLWNTPMQVVYHKRIWDGGYLCSAGDFGDKADYLRDFKNIRSFLELYFKRKATEEVICVPMRCGDFQNNFFHFEDNEILGQAYQDFIHFNLDVHHCPAVRLNLKSEKEILYNMISGAFNYLFEFGILLDDKQGVFVPSHHMDLCFLNVTEDQALYHGLVEQCEDLGVDFY